MVMADLFSVLDNLHIDYQFFEHPAVFTCEEAAQLCPKMPGVANKNLFLRDKKKNYILVIMPASKQLNLKNLEMQLQMKGVSFGSEDRLQEMLGVTKGSVTPFGLIHDHEKKIRVYIDCIVWNDAWVHFHPLRNTATVALRRTDFERFLQSTGHSYQILEL